LRHDLQIITEISIRKCSTLFAVIDNLSLRFGDCGELQRFRAEHYRFKGIAEFINCGGNALPLHDFGV